MIGQSVPMRRIMSLIERVASSDVPVLITGEGGTGKESTAQLSGASPQPSSIWSSPRA
jgi:DNA-binding NtrC family response regulator